MGTRVDGGNRATVEFGENLSWWRSSRPRLGALGLHKESEHITCGMAVGHEVSNSLNTSGKL